MDSAVNVSGLLLESSTRNATCSRVDDVFARMTEMRHALSSHAAEGSELIAPSIGVVASVIILFAGARVLRVTAALAAAGFAFWAVYAFLRDSADVSIGCDARLIAASIVAVLAAISAGCVYKAGLFFVGAAAAAGVVHMVFSTFPTLHAIDGVPTMGNRSIVYYALLLVGAACGGLVMRWNSKLILEVLTACIGGASLAYCLFAIASTTGARVDAWVFSIVGLASAAVGAVAQRHLRVHGDA